MSYYISQKTFFHKEQTSRCVSVERLVQAMFRKDIFSRKSSITALLFLFSPLPLSHLQQLISPSFFRDLALLMSTRDVAVRWSSLALRMAHLPKWLLSASPFGTALDVGHLLFQRRSPPFPHALPVTNCWDWFCLQPMRHRNLFAPTNTFVLLFKFLAVNKKI